MRKITVTKAEFEVLVESGKAGSSTFGNRSLGGVGRYGDITVNGIIYSQDIFLKDYGYTWRTSASGIHCFLMSETGVILEVCPIRYTKKGCDDGDTNADRIVKRFL